MQSLNAGRHEYRISGWQKFLYLILGLILTAIGVFAAGVLARESDWDMAQIAGILPLAIGIYLLAMVLRSRLVIDGSRIEVRGAFLERSAEFGDVEGFRTISTRNGSFWRLQLKQGRSSITIQQWFDCDELRAWFQQLTDLDEQDRKLLLHQIEQNQELGATPEDRLQALKRAKRWSIGLSVIAVLATVSAVIQLQSLRAPAAVVLALTPLAVLYLLNREPLFFALGKSRRDPRAELSIALLAAEMGLFFIAIGMNFVSMRTLLPFVGMVALAFIAAFYMLGRNGPPMQGFHALVLMSAGFYSFGLIAAYDTLLDRASVTVYATRVAGKHTKSGKSTTYYLEFDAWGPFDDANDIRVPRRVYRETQLGDTVCLRVHPGALHVAWYERVECDARQPTP
jgi:hypothetical protein